jgi:tripeptidyl-peptidase-1
MEFPLSRAPHNPVTSLVSLRMVSEFCKRKAKTDVEIGDYYDQADLNSFWKLFTTIPSGTGPKLDSVDGAVAPVSQSDGGGESLLDFEIAIPLLYPQTTILFQVDDANEVESTSGFGNTFLDALDAVGCHIFGPS